MADLTGDDLRDADLSEADIRGAKLNGAKFHGAKFQGAKLYGAELRRANLSGPILTRADLSKTDLFKANLVEVDLSGTLFYEATIGGTNFAGCDLSTAEGLETVRHLGPSTIGIDTLFRSKGKIPAVFLRGAGVPESLINYLPSLLGTGIEFYSLFISYSTADEEFAKRLYADLQAKHVRCWFAPHDMRSGKKVHEQIDEAIRVYDRLLLILSPSSMNSEWVKTEISKARQHEISGKRQVLFPIALCPFGEIRSWECFDSDAGKDSAREIREYFIPDFSNWKDHDSYQKAFNELMKDLNKNSELT